MARRSAAAMRAISASSDRGCSARAFACGKSAPSCSKTTWSLLMKRLPSAILSFPPGSLDSHARLIEACVDPGGFVDMSRCADLVSLVSARGRPKGRGAATGFGNFRGKTAPDWAPAIQTIQSRHADNTNDREYPAWRSCMSTASMAPPRRAQQISPMVPGPGMEERYELALESINEGVYDWNIETGDIYYSPLLQGMMGLSADSLATT